MQEFYSTKRHPKKKYRTENLRGRNQKKWSKEQPNINAYFMYN